MVLPFIVHWLLLFNVAYFSCQWKIKKEWWFFPRTLLLLLLLTVCMAYTLSLLLSETKLSLQCLCLWFLAVKWIGSPNFYRMQISTDSKCDLLNDLNEIMVKHTIEWFEWAFALLNMDLLYIFLCVCVWACVVLWLALFMMHVLILMRLVKVYYTVGKHFIRELAFRFGMSNAFCIVFKDQINAKRYTIFRKYTQFFERY